MPRRFLFAFAACLVLSTFALAREPEALDHKQLLYFTDDNGAVQPVRTLDDWNKRRRQILAGFQEATGPLPDRTKRPPLDVQVSEETEILSIVVDGSFESGGGLVDFDAVFEGNSLEDVG